MNLILWLSKETGGIDNSPYKKKYHLESDESDWHPSLWLLFQLLFEMNFCGGDAIFTYLQIFSGLEEELCLWAPMQSLVSCYGDTTEKTFFFCFHITQNKFSVRHIPGIMHEAWRSPHFCMDFIHLRVVLVIYYKCMHLLIHFNAGVTQLHLFPFSAVPTFQQRCLLATTAEMFDSST